MSSPLKLSLVIQPNAKKTEWVGVVNGELKVKIQAQPIDGKANAALIDFLAKEFKTQKKHVQIIRGETSKHKVVEIAEFARVPAIVDDYRLSHGNTPSCFD